MRFASLMGISLVFAILIFGASFHTIAVFGQTSDPNQGNSIELEGTFNVLEIIYADGTYDFKYFVFVENELANIPTPYEVEFSHPTGALMDLVSENVKVRGNIPDSAVSQFSFSSIEAPIMVDSIEKITPNQDVQSFPEVSQTSTAGTPVPSELQTHVILSKFSGLNGTEPHNVAYFNNLFFNSTAGAYSLTNYYLDASYGALNITSSGINDWSQLANPTSFYADLTTPTILSFVGHAIAAAEASSAIDYNGPDGIIQNSTPANLTTAGPNGDDIDQIIFIYNGNSFDETPPGGCSCAFAFLGPVQLTTVQGDMFFLLSFLPDLPPLSGFAVHTSYRGGIGVLTHEYGHSLGWDHTPTPPPFGSVGPYADPWSTMSKISDSIPENAAGPVAYNRDHAGWIPAGDIHTVFDGQTSTFTLDMLSNPSPGPGFLMAKVPWGAGDDYYALEARIDAQFDHTPGSVTGLVIYHVTNTGHPLTAEPTAEASIVDVKGATTTADWKDAYLDTGESITINGVKITHMFNDATSITVKVENNVPDNCSPPGSGDWTITVSCTMTSNATSAGNVIVQNGAVLTIPNGITLTVPSGFGVNVQSGGGISIAIGGTLIIIA